MCRRCQRVSDRRWCQRVSERRWCQRVRVRHRLAGRLPSAGWPAAVGWPEGAAGFILVFGSHSGRKAPIATTGVPPGAGCLVSAEPDESWSGRPELYPPAAPASVGTPVAERNKSGRTSKAKAAQLKVPENGGAVHGEGEPDERLGEDARAVASGGNQLKNSLRP